jgi:hypothetical protein
MPPMMEYIITTGPIEFEINLYKPLIIIGKAKMRILKILVFFISFIFFWVEKLIYCKQ